MKVDKIYIGPATFFTPIEGSVRFIEMDFGNKSGSFVQCKILNKGEKRLIQIPLNSVLYFMYK